MKVKAKDAGFFNGRLIKKGEEFILPDVVVESESGKKDTKKSKAATEQQFSSKWMEKV